MGVSPRIPVRLQPARLTAVLAVLLVVSGVLVGPFVDSGTAGAETLSRSCITQVIAPSAPRPVGLTPLSDDAKVMAYATKHPDLGARLFVRDLGTNTDRQLVQSPVGEIAVRDMSSDGRHILIFASEDLGPADWNDAPDLFIVDAQTGGTTRIAQAAGELRSTKENKQAYISDNGNTVVFDTTDRVLLEDTDSGSDVYLWTRSGGISMLSSVGGSETPWGGMPSMSDDGKIVSLSDGYYQWIINLETRQTESFYSGPGGIVTGDGKRFVGRWDSFLVGDLLAGNGTSADLGDSPPGTDGRVYAVSDTGRYLAYDGWVRDTATAETWRVPSAPGTTPTTNYSFAGASSIVGHDGQVVEPGTPHVTSPSVQTSHLGGAASPVVLTRGQAPKRLDLVGENFRSGMTVSLGGVVTSALTVTDSQHASLLMTVPPTAALGPQPLTLTASNGCTAVLKNFALVTDAAGQYHPLTPYRALDTRTATGGHRRPLASGESFSLKVTGTGGAFGVPQSNVDSVVLNVTSTQPTSTGYVTVWPKGTKRPVSSNLNFVKGATRPNLVTSKVGSDGSISLFNSAGSTHLVVDVVGYYSTSGGSLGSTYVPIVPARFADTRERSPWGPGVAVGRSSIKLGNPPPEVDALALNVTVTNPQTAGYLTVFPYGANGTNPVPKTSNLNFVAGDTVANMVIVPVGAVGSGLISLYASTRLDVVVDVVGVFVAPGSADGAAFTSAVPRRILDTRSNIGGIGTKPIGPSGTARLAVAGRNGVPADATAVLVNLTSTQPTKSGYLTAWPSGFQRPLASSLNFRANQTIPNLVAVPIGGDGSIAIFNSAGSTHVIADVVGWYRPT